MCLFRFTEACVCVCLCVWSDWADVDVHARPGHNNMALALVFMQLALSVGSCIVQTHNHVPSESRSSPLVDQWTYSSWRWDGGMSPWYILNRPQGLLGNKSTWFKSLIYITSLVHFTMVLNAPFPYCISCFIVDVFRSKHSLVLS